MIPKIKLLDTDLKEKEYINISAIKRKHFINYSISFCNRLVQNCFIIKMNNKKNRYIIQIEGDENNEYIYKNSIKEIKNYIKHSINRSRF